ncbi:MAG: CBS domain-containing protein, partial [Planctomycetes bacterium]|nr:CBS domain-containing protein [Planctomycetota bacterium]
NVVTVRREDTLVTLILKFRKYNFHTLPVIDKDGKLMGIVTPEDIMRIFLPHNPVLDTMLTSTHLLSSEEDDILESEISTKLANSIMVSDIMNTNVVTIDEDKTIADTRRVMKLHKVERVPVTRDNTLIGFITLFDIIVALFRERNIIP